MPVCLTAISLQQKNVEPHASWVRLQVFKDTAWLFPSSLCSSSPLLSLHCLYTLLSMNAINIPVISLHLYSNSCLDHFFFNGLLKAIYPDHLVPAHPYLHISFQYTSTLLFFITNSLFPFPGSQFHNPCLSLLNSQVLTSCPFCPNYSNTYSRSTKFWEKSLSSRSQHHNCLHCQEKPAPCRSMLVSQWW